MYPVELSIIGHLVSGTFYLEAVLYLVNFRFTVHISKINL